MVMETSGLSDPTNICSHSPFYWTIFVLCSYQRKSKGAKDMERCEDEIMLIVNTLSTEDKLTFWNYLQEIKQSQEPAPFAPQKVL